MIGSCRPESNASGEISDNGLVEGGTPLAGRQLRQGYHLQRKNTMRYILVLLAVLICTPALADGWKLNIKLHENNTLTDTLARLTKDFGGLKLSGLARNFDDGVNEGNHLNLSLAGDWFGAEYMTGDHIRNNLQSFSVIWPSRVKPTVYQTPCQSVVHLWANTQFDGGTFQTNFYQKDEITEFDVNITAEF